MVGVLLGIAALIVFFGCFKAVLPKKDERD